MKNSISRVKADGLTPFSDEGCESTESCQGFFSQVEE